MVEGIKTLRTCSKGHQHYKSSDCPVCPVCAGQSVDEGDVFSSLSAPARRALQTKGVTSLEQLSACSESELLNLHGMGPASIPKLRKLLESCGLAFKG